MHHYIAKVVSRLLQEGDCNDDRQTCGCVARLWQ